MAKKTKQLQTQWWDWLSTAERLLLSLHEQTAALTLRRVERLEEIQPEIDSLLNRMNQIDDDAVASARALAEDFGCEPDLRSLVGALEKAEAQEVQSIANRVIVVGRNVQTVIDRNRALIENELEYVNGTLAVVDRTMREQEGPYAEKNKSGNLVMNQVA
ncbi:MAG TPA: flagellar export chaperone FlgN [Fimbriimonadaceae bacterium]|nr:flagellar export chaperone FlgN [Fimbriimonadaceae bacterium]